MKSGKMVFDGEEKYLLTFDTKAEMVCAMNAVLNMDLNGLMNNLDEYQDKMIFRHLVLPIIQNYIRTGYSDEQIEHNLMRRSVVVNNTPDSLSRRGVLRDYVRELIQHERGNNHD